MHDCNGHEIREGDILISLKGLETIKIRKINKKRLEKFAYFRGVNESQGLNEGIMTQYALEVTRRVRATITFSEDKSPYKPRTDALYPDELALRDELPDKDQLKLIDAWNEVDYFLKTMIEEKS